MIVAVPKEIGVSVVPTTVATAGLDELNVHAPGDVDVGRTKVKLATLSFMIEIFPKVPTTGCIATIVNFVVVVPANQLIVRPCVPVIVIVPPSINVTTSPAMVAIFGLDDV